MSEEAVADELQRFHDQRAEGIGATDSPKILGLSRWGTALTVYEDKLKLVPPTPSSLPAWLGKKMQATVGELYTAATGHRLRAVGDLQQFRMKGHPWIVCHLDFRVWGAPGLLVEAKTRAYEHGYGEDGSTDVPAEEWVQCQHEMAVTGATETHLAVLFGHRSFRVYPLKRDDEFIAKLVPRLDEFWWNNVLAQVPPLVTGHPADEAALRRRYPDDDGDFLQASAEQEQLFRDLVAVQENKRQVERREAELKNLIRDLIGSHSGIRGAFGEVTYKRSAPSTVVAWDLVAKAYRGALEATTPQFLSDQFGTTDLDDVESLHTSEQPGSRRFLLKTGEPK